MSTLKIRASRFVTASAAVLAFCASAPAWEPNAKDLDAAVNAGDFSDYQTKLTAWLGGKVPAEAAKITEDSLKTLLKNPAFVAALDQRQFIAKAGADQLAAFAKSDAANKAFLTWLMNDATALDLFLEGVVPLSLGAREQNDYRISPATLETWKRIFTADPDSKQGLYLRLAIATAIAPPGSGSPGAGQIRPAEDPVERYKHFKSAHQNKELFPSFDNLTVWELQKVVQSGASNADLAWARQMINTWRPDLRVNEQVVNSTSEVWRRSSPHPYTDYKSVLSGGGKCGPRSSWSVMICQAFGIPAIGVGQPAHACVAYKVSNPALEPQPGSAWKVGYGRGWPFSKLEGMSGPEFLTCVEQRSRAIEFSQVEHLRALASALTSADQAGAVMAAAHAIQKSTAEKKTDITASAKASEAEKELTPEVKSSKEAASKEPIKVGKGTTRIEAAAFSSMSGIRVLDCYTGGKQVNFQKSIDNSFVEYTLDVEAAGTYTIEMKVAAANLDQVFNITAGNEQVSAKVPYTTGLWDVTPVVEIKLDKGRQTLKIAAPNQRGVALRTIELKSKN